MRKKILVIILFLYLLCPSYSFAWWAELNQQQIEEAIKYGKDLYRKLGQDSDWSARSSRAAGWVELTTPFSALAKLARERSLESKAIKESDIKKAMAPYKRKLIFNYYFYDVEKLFSLNAQSEYFATLRTANDRFIYPLRYDKGTELVKKINLEFSFSAEKIEPDSVVFLLVREPSGFEQEFKFDLSKIH